MVYQINKVLNHFVGRPEKLFKEIVDRRVAGCCTYSLPNLLMQAVYLFLVQGQSRNKMNGFAKNFKSFKKNFELQFPGMKLAHFDTVNNVIRSIKVEELLGVLKRLIYSLIRGKVIKPIDGYYHILIDATGICSYKNAPVDNACHQTSKNGVTTYSAKVLEAKILTKDHMVLSLVSELISNEGKSEFDKQDCELMAFKRLAEQLHEYFPRLPICIHLDGLYANGPVMEICERFGWKYIITRKDGNLKDIDQQIIDKRIIEKKKFSYPVVLNPKCKKAVFGDANYHWVEDLTHQDYQFNYMEGIIPIYKPKTGSTEATKFAFITNLGIDEAKAIVADKKNGLDDDKIESAIMKLIECGRLRWKIENEGFNIQKNNGFNMEHKFVRNSITNLHKYYLLLQIAHIITQLTLKSKVVAAYLAKDATTTIQSLWEGLRSSILGEHLLNAERLVKNRNTKCQIRLE